MNILRIVYEWPPPWHGLAPGPYELTRAQAAQGHKTRFLCGGWPRRPTADPAADNISVYRLPAALPGLSLFATTAPIALLAAVAQHRWADIVHGHGHLPSWLHGRKKWLPQVNSQKLPYVFHLHVTAAGRAAHARLAKEQRNFWTKRVEWPLHQLSDQWGCDTADAIICVSDSVRDEAIRHYNAPPDRLHVVPNGVDTLRFQPQGQSHRHHLGFGEKERIILFVGALTDRKRPILLLQALTFLPSHWRVVFIGDGPLRHQLVTQANELGVTKQVTFTGSIPYPDLPGYYRAADVFALTAAYEGFPKVVLEALATGIPVVTTPSFAPDRHIAPFLTVIAEPSPEATAAAVEKAVGVRVDHQLISERFSWRSRARTIDQIYEQIR